MHACPKLSSRVDQSEHTLWVDTKSADEIIRVISWKRVGVHQMQNLKEMWWLAFGEKVLRKASYSDGNQGDRPVT